MTGTQLHTRHLLQRTLRAPASHAPCPVSWTQLQHEPDSTATTAKGLQGLVVPGAGCPNLTGPSGPAGPARPPSLWGRETDPCLCFGVSLLWQPGLFLNEYILLVRTVTFPLRTKPPHSRPGGSHLEAVRSSPQEVVGHFWGLLGCHSVLGWEHCGHLLCCV